MTVYDMSGNPATWQPGVMKMTYFGCPWHGVLKNGELYANDFTTHKKSLPNWTQVASARVNSATQLVRVPGMPAISRTSEQQTWDAAQGFDWKNYALVGGYHLYGKALHSNWIIYIDGNNVPWMLDMYLSAGGAGFYCNVYLRRIFGRISETSYPVINSTLATYSDNTMQAVSGAVYKYSGPESIERNSTGSVVFVNVYAYKTRASLSVLNLGVIDGGNDQFNSYKPKLGQLLGVYKVEITGNGSTVPGSLGDGISATVSLHKDYSDCYSTGSRVVGQNENVYTAIDDIDTYNTYDNDPRVSPPCPAEYVDETTTHPTEYATQYSSITEYYETRLIRVLFDPSDGVVEYAAEYTGNHITANWNTTDHVKTVSLSGTVVNTTTYTVAEIDGACQITGSSSECTGSITRTINEQTKYYKKLSLLRNGTEVAGGDLTTTQTFQRIDTLDCGGYSENITVDTTVHTCNGVELPAGTDIDDFHMTVHPYSPQIYGVMLRDIATVPPQISRIEAVMTPWGADTAHQHTDLSHDGYNCVGSHEPLEQKVYWYESGVTDVANAKINFI